MGSAGGTEGEKCLWSLYMTGCTSHTPEWTWCSQRCRTDTSTVAENRQSQNYRNTHVNNEIQCSKGKGRFRQTCLSVSADSELGLDNTGAAGGRVARRGRSHTSQRMLLPGFTTVQLLHFHSEGSNIVKNINILTNITTECYTDTWTASNNY